MCILLHATVKQCGEVNTFVPLQMSGLERKRPKSRKSGFKHNAVLSSRESRMENYRDRLVPSPEKPVSRMPGMEWPAEAGWLFGQNVAEGFKRWTFRLKAIVFQPRNTMGKAVLSTFYTDFVLSRLLAFHDYRLQYLYSKKIIIITNLKFP